MDLTAAIAEAKARGFDYLTDARVTIALNNAKNEFEDFFDWPWLETTATGVTPLSLADVKKVLYVVDTTNGATLSGVEAQDVVDLDPNITYGGPPLCWWLDGTGTLKTYPTQAAASLSVRYVKFSNELSAPADTPSIPARYHPLWIDLAVIELAKDDEDFQDVQALRQDTQMRLAQLAEIYGTRNLANAPLQAVYGYSEDW